MTKIFYHKDLTDEQWNKIKFLFERERKIGRPTMNPRNAFNGILWILRSGARWRDLPQRYGNWNSIYYKFRHWIEGGIFEKLLEIVNKKTDNFQLLKIDSTFCKVHQSACSAFKNQEIGSSRGGKTTKIHVVITEHLQLLNAILSAGNINDNQKAIELLDKINIEDKTILADKAYGSEQIRCYIERRGASVCIADKCNSTVKHAFDKELYKKRNLVERFFQRIKNFRHIAFRFDKLAVCFLNFILIASALIHF